MLIVHEKSADDAGPEEEFEVPGILEWNDSDFTLRREGGAIVLQVETKFAHKCVDVATLFGADVLLQFSSPDRLRRQEAVQAFARSSRSCRC